LIQFIVSLLQRASFYLTVTAWVAVSSYAGAKPKPRDTKVCSSVLSRSAELEAMNGEVIYVVDTNVLYADPAIFNRMGDKTLVLPRSVIGELDRHKSELSDRGQSSRDISRQLRRLMEANRGKSEIKLSNGGRLLILEVSDDYKFPVGLDREKVDDRIVALARELQDLNKHRKVVVLSGDNNVANLTFALGLDADEVATSIDPAAVKELIQGPVRLVVSNENMTLIRDSRTLDLNDLRHLGFDPKAEPYENQYVVFEAETPSETFDLKEALSRVWRFHQTAQGALKFYPADKKEILALTIQPRNIEQIIAADLLVNPHISVVTLAGLAGTGKTLLTLASGVAHSALFTGRATFERIILTRPYQVTGEQMGFLPGDLKDKMAPFMGPFRDNIEVIVEAMRKDSGLYKGRYEEVIRRNGQQEELARLKNLDTGVRSANSLNGNGSAGPKKLSFEDIIGDKYTPREIAERLIGGSDLFSIEAIAYTRGRTWNNTLLIVDEAQNMTMHEVKTLLTRVGEGTKVVLLGDLEQIDNKLLNHSNNGLIITASRMRGLPFVGHMNLTIGERSEVATEAARRLQP